MHPDGQKWGCKEIQRAAVGALYSNVLWGVMRGGGERKNEMSTTPASRLPKQLWALFLFLTERKIISQTSDKPHTDLAMVAIHSSTVGIKWSKKSII